MDINKIADQIAAEEDFKSTVYLDTQNFPTIGYGRLLEATPMTEKEAKRKYGNLKETEKEARAKMIQYIKETAIPNAKNFIGEGFDDLSSEVQTATVSLAYNVGGSGINQFNTLRDSLKNNDLKGASQSLMGSLAGVQALFRYAEIIEKSFGKENMPTPEELKANPRAAELLNFIHGRKVLGKPIPKVFEQYIDNNRIKGATVIDFLPENLQQIYNANGGGIEGAKAVQQELGVKDDGIIGPGTLRKALEDERRSKAGSYSKQEVEEDKISFNVSEKEKEEPSFFDNIKDFFGMSAEASDVPPIETLQEPQEEVPMSPTDAMRAQSQGRVILDSAQSVPTNPEAGPSDTVPAMLTPGEAVIPAAAAQDPDNKPVIKKMIEEGRAKNRMAETNGVPVNGKEAIMYDDAELDAYHKRNKTGKYGGGEMSLQGFAGGTMNIPKGMHMMPDGSLMKDEDHKGYGHGTMDVPAMIMMAPPKDPAMDEMEKLALKQMGYEMKSKNRTRDTIEKIGLKHLEDTADANMKQAALDETMKNYGMEVPMPMKPVPQGFQDGTPGLYDERPSLSFGQQILSGIAGPKTDLYDDKTDAELAEIARFGSSELEMSAAQRELSRRQAQTPVGAELEMPAEGTDIKIAGSDISIPAPETVPEKDLTQEVKVETPDDGGGDGSGFGKAIGAFFSSIGSSLANTAQQVFDPTSIGRAAMTFTTLRLMGMPARASGQYALNAYQTGQRQFAEAIKQKGLTDRASIKQSSANYVKLQNDITKQLKAIMSEKELQETAAKLGVTTEVLASTLISNLQDRGYNDISSAEALGQVTDIANIAVNTFRNDLRKGVVSNDLGAVLDRSLTSVVELGDAFADVTPEVQNTLFTGIRRNIPEKLKGMKGTEELRNRVSDIYQYYKNNREKVAELNLRAPGVGENEFTVFLEAVLDQGGIRTVV